MRPLIRKRSRQSKRINPWSPYVSKIKRDWRIKGRTCADEKRGNSTKDEAVEPTAAPELVLLTCAVNTHEGRDVEITNILGAYLSTDIEKLVVTVLCGELEELLTLTDTVLYRKYTVVDSIRKTILYVKLQKALYRYIIISLLFYEKIARELKVMGFIIISYEPCLENKTVNRKKST